MSKLENHPVSLSTWCSSLRRACVSWSLLLFVLRRMCPKVMAPPCTHVSWPGPQYSQLAGRAGGSASMGSAVRFGLLSAAVALLHRRNSERKVMFGKEKKQACRQVGFLHTQRMCGLLIYCIQRRKDILLDSLAGKFLHCSYYNSFN